MKQSPSSGGMDKPTRPTSLMDTGELAAARRLADEQVAAHDRSAIVPIEHYTRSGYVAYFDYAGAAYSISTRCACPDVAINLSADGTPRDYLNATSTCPAHGSQQSIAVLSYITPQRKRSPIFAWVEQRHARDRRVQWGMRQSPSSGGMKRRTS